MNNKTGILPIIFKSLGLAALGLFTFMGCVYTFSDIIISSIITLLLLIIVAVLSYYLEVWKGKQVKGNDDFSGKTAEFLLGGIYILVAGVIYVFANHYFNVEVYEKDKLRSEIFNKIEQIKDMDNNYKLEVDNKDSALTRCVESQINQLSRPEVLQNPALRVMAENAIKSCLGDAAIPSTVEGIRNRLRDKRDYVRQVKYNIDSIKTTSEEYLLELELAATNWPIETIKLTYEGIDTKTREHLMLLKKKMEDYNYEYEGNLRPFPNTTNSFTQAPLVNVLAGFAFYAFMHLFILGSYIFVVKRHRGLIHTNTNTYIQGDISNKI